ncbi:MAG: thiamine phosphate synthase [Rhodobacteraceae bacterium]|jgi:thiamine-phosphate pyrophosphorylase|uniref:thiamine phosphate synthase n=1 Tax=Roseovarius sp. 10 TaxID=3080563 RepID=UPI0019389AB4|nr:thiamine phosphate synthase [Roseovarius sp. 10]MBE1288553.1 thiamine phosphate synthase [Paracoccaceae bacterium]MBF9024203.1 thiamine phosphate synthase [Rhodobacterales bacterium HKCCD6035]MDV7199894.1 thiamine phosphate synthase [Roseovarius sp. 10]QPI86024.1 thiamine phosphate synthase [Rhodobacterales bacterium HKCCA1288]
MSDMDIPQIYLVTPPNFELTGFGAQLAAVLDAYPIACLRLALASRDEDDLARAADHLREIAHARDIPLVMSEHIKLVERLGLDGVHLLDGSRSTRKTRADLGGDAIIGCFCANSRHDGMNAGEMGADYISFGPVGDTSLGDGSRAEDDLFAWWSQMIELPVVAEGALTLTDIERLAPITDFFAIGEEIWRKDDPVAALKTLLSPLG